MEQAIHPIVAEELEGLENVLRRLAAVRPATDQAETPILRELERLRHLLVSREDSKDVAALSDQWHRQSSILRQLRRGRPTKAVDPHSPYFAHLRLSEGGEERELYLGHATCIDGGLRIVDWRDAPISKIFYRYQQGEDYDEEIAGRMRSGEVVARRMMSIRAGTLERVQSPEGDFRLRAAGPSGPTWTRHADAPPRLAGGRALAVRDASAGGISAQLGASGGPVQRADKHLAEITGLIDPDQFELITRPTGFLVIRGVAGSGKTTVALHRVAYLAFDDPTIDSEDTVVFVFSEALRRYVDHVLPSLGLDDVRVLTYGEWVRRERQRHFPELPTGRRADTPGSVARLKLRPALGSVLAEYIRAKAGPRTPAQALDDWASVLTHRRLLREAFMDAGPGDDAVTEGELDAFIRWNAELVDDVMAHVDGDPDVKVALDPEDDALLLRAHQLRVGPLRGKRRRPLSFRHVVIDEIQDFSALEVRVLLDCLGPEPSITLAGDTQQHIVSGGGFSSWSGFFDDLGVAGTEIETLRIAYRSTEPIMRVAYGLLASLQEDEEVPETTRSGAPVELFRFEDVGACIGFLSDVLRDVERTEPLASVAVLAPHAAVADLYHDGLERAELRRLRRIRRGEFPFSPGIEVTEVEQAKGLEFDYVILVDVSAASYPDRPTDRRRLHVGATRAVHQLWLTCVGAPSPMLQDLALED